MKQIITSHLLRGADAPTISSFFMSFSTGIFTALMTFLEVYSGQIGAACTIVSLFFMIFFGIANGRKLDRSADNSERSALNSENIEKLSKLFNSKFNHLERTLKSKGDSNEKRKAK